LRSKREETRFDTLLKNMVLPGLSSPPGANDMEAQGYCVKCKEKREMVGAEQVEMKTGRKALKGKCKVCSTGMYKILGNAAAKPA